MTTNGFVPIGDVIECLVREVERRREAYPHLILSGKLHRRTATKELDRMEAALKIVRAATKSTEEKEVRE